MKEKTKITEQELITSGWKRIGSFGYCYIFEKEDETILWHPVSEMVVFSYKKGGGNEKLN